MLGKQDFINAGKELAGCAVLLAGMVGTYLGTEAIADAALTRHHPISVVAPIKVATDFSAFLAMGGLFTYRSEKRAVRQAAELTP
jgi:hypothetical protein